MAPVDIPVEVEDELAAAADALAEGEADELELARLDVTVITDLLDGVDDEVVVDLVDIVDGVACRGQLAAVCV